MGFREKWIHWIMRCVKSVSYSVLINGNPTGQITPSRGLRQGDPLSPYLFILCTEVLIANIRTAENLGQITGLKVAKASPPISHLLFADDSLFFCKAVPEQCNSLLNALNTYGSGSGQRINFEKSAITFGKKVPQENMENLQNILGITTESGNGKYLGIPELLQGSKTQAFAYVQNNIHKKVNGWTAKYLSRAGKEVMIKSVAAAIPTFPMSCYLLPKGLCKKISSATSNFWWGSGPNSKGMHWISWDKLCLSKKEGGIGFRSLEEFNIALLAKQLWRLEHNPNSLLTRVLKGRYFRNSHPFKAPKASRPSYGWRSMMAAKDLVTKGLRRTIGTGEDTLVWQDLWLPDETARPPTITHDYDPNLRVSDLIDPVEKEWDNSKLRSLLHPNDIPLVRSLNLKRNPGRDGYCWNLTTSGKYSVKSGYMLARSKPDEDTEFRNQLPSLNPLKEKIWKVKTGKKICYLMWQILSGAISVNERLFKRHIGNDPSCPRCGCAEETINHTIFTCPPAMQCWALSTIPSVPGVFPSENLYTNMDYLLSRSNTGGTMEELTRVFPWIIWYIWKARNEKLFNGREFSPMDTIDLAIRECNAWFLANEVIDPGESTMECIPRTPTEVPTFICRVDGSWKNDETTSGVGWILQLQDGSIDILGLQGCHRQISPLHTELKSLI